MLYAILPRVMNMSGVASLAILFVLLIRFVIKKAPKVYSYILWMVVLFRLLCPVSLSSDISLYGIFNAPTRSSSFIGNTPTNTVYTEDVKEDIIPVSSSIEKKQIVVKPLKTIMVLGTYVWIFGMFLLLAYSVITFIRLHRKLTGSVLSRDNIYYSDYITSPFVVGIFRPRIYLPSFLTEKEEVYIILHEQHHIRRLDHIVKMLAFFGLCIHWFNPLVWMAFVLITNDMEMSCDEAVMKKMGNDIRGDYSASLLCLATGRHIRVGSPLAFGEGDTKGRIKNVLSWKKPTLWIVITAFLICMVVSVALFTNPKEKIHNRVEGPQKVENNKKEQSQKVMSDLEISISTAILGHNKSDYMSGDFSCESHVVLATEKKGSYSGGGSKRVTVYAMVLYSEYGISVDGIEDIGGSHVPTALTFDIAENGVYTLAEYWQPRDGSYYVSDIKKKFPKNIYKDAIDTQKFIVAQIQSSYHQAVEYGKIDTDKVIGKLFETIMSSPEEASSPYDYIKGHDIEYRELMYYGDYTLQYVFSQFLNGNQRGLKGNIMRMVLDDLAPESKMRLQTETGQEYFDVWHTKAKELEVEKGLEYMKEKAHGMWMLLQMERGD